MAGECCRSASLYLFTSTWAVDKAEPIPIGTPVLMSWPSMFEKNSVGIHTVGRIVRTGVDAAWLLEIVAEVAGGGFADLAVVSGIRAITVELVDGDVAVGAVRGAEAAADAPVFNDDFERVAAADAPDWDSQPCRAGSRHWRQDVATRYLSKRTPSRRRRGNAVVRLRARLHALIAPRTFLEVEDEQALGVHQALRQEAVQRSGVRFVGGALGLEDVLLIALAGDVLDLDADLREAVEHGGEIRRVDLYDLDVVERRAGGGARHIAEQAHLAEVAATREGRRAPSLPRCASG